MIVKPACVPIFIILHGSHAEDSQGLAGVVVRPIHAVATGSVNTQYLVFVGRPAGSSLVSRIGACWHSDVSKGCASVECTSAQRWWRGRLHDDVGQTGATAKGIGIDGADAVGHPVVSDRSGDSD